MFRNLIILAAIILLVLIVRNRLRNRQQDSSNSKTVTSVQCAHCREYLPKQSAVYQQGQYFCNTDHYQAWQDNAD